MQRINSETAHKILMQNRNVVVLDLRDFADYKKGHLKNAINIDAYEVYNKIKGIVNDKNTIIIVYCYTGSVSLGVAIILNEIGYKWVYDLGYITDWKYGLFV